MKSLQSSSIVWIFIYYLFCQGALGLKSGSESSALPKGPSEILTASGGHATTTVFLEATRNGRHPIGILTSTVDKFINAGTTTEYMTQHVGTYLADKYAKVESTATREYYRVISPTKSLGGTPNTDLSTPTKKPTGMVASSVRYDVNGRKTTEYTVEQFRTYIDGHYAHLISSVSKVYSDPPIISATPVYDPSGLRSGYSRGPHGGHGHHGHILPDRPKEGTIPTQTIGYKYAKKYEQRLKLDDLFDEAIKDEEDNEASNIIRARSIQDNGNLPDLLDLQEVEPSPVEKSKALPTFTVKSDGEINIPSIDVIELENEIEPSVSPQHRFEPNNNRIAASKTALDSVTYIGFVDFTTTIDDTVVIFQPKKSFSTATRNIFIPKIEPTLSSERINLFKPSVAATPPLRSSSSNEKDQEEEAEEPRGSDPDLNIISPSISSNSNNRLNDLIKKNRPSQSSNDRFKSLFGGIRRNPLQSSKFSPAVSSVSSQSGAIRPSAASDSGNLGGRPKITLLHRPNGGSNGAQAGSPQVELSSSNSGSGSAPEINELSSSINPDSDVELVYKTLYTTYTYFTTFFRASTTRVKSREEVISNVVTLTNILGPSDLAKLKSSCEVDNTCQFISSTATKAADFTNGFIGRPNTKVIDEEPRSGSNSKKQMVDQEVNGVFKTFFTTYTYFTTLFVDGSSSISTRTEVYSNVQSSGVPVGIPATNIPKLESTLAAALINNKQQQSSSRSANPRRLEYSSIARKENENQKSTNNNKDLVILDLADEDLIDPTKPSNEVIEVEEEEILLSDDEELQLADENQIDASSVVIPISPASAVKTFYTTYTYFTTLFRNGTSFVTSNLETVTNTADATASPTLVQPSVTFYTTFTYWTTSIDGDKTVITSREETKTDILAATVTDSLQILPTSVGIGIDATEEPSVGLLEALENNIAEGDDTSIVPELESGEVETTLAPSSISVTPSLSSSEFVSSSSLASASAADFNDLDDDFILASSSVDDLENSEESTETEVDDDEDQSIIRPAPSSSLTFSRSSSTFRPVIRPNLFKPKSRIRQNALSRSRSRSTTVAIITRSDVTPTLIATPVSSLQPSSSPAFTSSRSRGAASGTSAVLNSASILNRGRSSSISSSPSSSAATTSSSILASSSLNPSRASSSAIVQGSSDIEPTSASGAAASSIANKPSIKLFSSVRRPNPFRAQLKERQRARLAQLRAQNKKERRVPASVLNSARGSSSSESKSEEKSPVSTSSSQPTFRLPSLGGGADSKAPIFVSSRTETFRRQRPEPESTSAEISLPPAIATRRERARQRINALFRRREPSFLRPRPAALGIQSDDNGDLQSQASTRRRKRQVSSGYDNYGTRTRARQSYVRKYRSSDAQNSYTSYQSPHSSYQSSFNSNPYTSTYSSPATSGGTSASGNYDYSDYSNSYSSSSTASNKPSTNSKISNKNNSKSRRLVRQNTGLSSSGDSRSRSRFGSSSRNTRTRSRVSSAQATTTTQRPSFSRFRPRTVSNRGGSSNRFTSSGRRPSTSLFDYDDYGDYDYDYDIDLQSSQNSHVPDEITVTHTLPVHTKIPVFENGRNALRDILTTSPSLEVIAVTALKSTNIDGSPVIYANAHTNTPNLGTQVLTFEALRATETTAVEMTPTRIRGLRTSFSHIIPSTIYNIRPVTTSIIQEVDHNQLLSSLLLQLLGGSSPKLGPIKPTQAPRIPASNNPAGANPGLLAGVGAGRSAAIAGLNNQIPQALPATQFITHTSTYVTTLTNVESTVLPITLRGREIKTTLVESKTEVVTATELSTETLVAPTTTAAAAGALGGLLGGLGVQPTAGPASNPLSNVLPADLQQQLLLAQLQQQLKQQQQQLLNQQLLSQVNLDQEGAINVEQTQIPDQIIQNPVSTSVVTIFVSGSKPGDFTRITSTVTLNGSNFDPGILDEWPEGIRILRKLAKRSDDSEISRRRLKTKFVGDVEVVVKDPDLAEGRDWPMTLSPQLVRRQFDINVNEAQQYVEPSSVIKTEYSTFTYFITSLDGSQTVTSTDIVISSNIVTETVAPTPALPQGLASSDYSQSPQDAVPSGYQVLATKTYFTTSTYYTTLIEQSRTITRTRTKVKSSIVTETYNGGNFEQHYGSNNQDINNHFQSTTLVPGQAQEKYLSLGPDIYGKIKTLFTTFTYFTTDLLGSVAKSMEVITQVSTSLFSTTSLPPSITLASSINVDGQNINNNNVQLSADELQSIKESYLSNNYQTQSPDLTPGQAGQVDGVISSKPGAGIIWDKPYLSSLKESFESSLSASSVSQNPSQNRPEADLDLPDQGPGVVQPPSGGGGSTSGSSANIKPSRPVRPGDAVEIQDNNKPTSSSSSSSDDESDDGNGSQPIDLETSQSQRPENNDESSDSSNNNNAGGGGGIINAVVGGIADGLGLGSSNNDDDDDDSLNSSGIQVDLGPVLDAVATLLRGPIRSAIANRRSEFLKRSDDPVGGFNKIKATRRVTLPKVARERGQEPNFIPVGNHQNNPFLRQNQSPQQVYESQPQVIPLRNFPPEQRNNNGNILQALPRKDTEGELEYIDSLQDVSDLFLKNNGNNDLDQSQITVDGDKVIINGHIVNSDNPAIVDVLNRKEQSHLFGHSGGPMAIKILPGTPMDMPKQVRVPGKPLDPNEVTMIGNLEDEIPPPPPPKQQQQRPRPPQKRPPPPPQAPPRPSSGGKRPQRPPSPPARPPPPPPRRPPPPPLKNNQDKKKQQQLKPRPPLHGPRGARPPPPRPRYPTVASNNDLDDSVSEDSFNQEVVVTKKPFRPPPGYPQPQPENINRPPPPRPKRPPPPPKVKRPPPSPPKNPPPRYPQQQPQPRPQQQQPQQRPIVHQQPYQSQPAKYPQRPQPQNGLRTNTNVAGAVQPPSYGNNNVNSRPPPPESPANNIAGGFGSKQPPPPPRRPATSSGQSQRPPRPDSAPPPPPGQQRPNYPPQRPPPPAAPNSPPQRPSSPGQQRPPPSSNGGPQQSQRPPRPDTAPGGQQQRPNYPPQRPSNVPSNRPNQNRPGPANNAQIPPNNNNRPSNYPTNEINIIPQQRPPPPPSNNVGPPQTRPQNTRPAPPVSENRPSYPPPRPSNPPPPSSSPPQRPPPSAPRPGPPPSIASPTPSRPRPTPPSATRPRPPPPTSRPAAPPYNRYPGTFGQKLPIRPPAPAAAPSAPQEEPKLEATINYQPHNQADYEPPKEVVTNVIQGDNQILIKEDTVEKDYTQIDEPSNKPPYGARRPTTSKRPEKRPSLPGSRYDINGNTIRNGNGGVGAVRQPYITDNQYSNNNNPNAVNPNRERKPAKKPSKAAPSSPSTSSDNSGGNQLIGNYGVKDEDFYQDVTVTNTNGQYQVIQTKYDQIDPSFTVNANYGQRTPPAYIDTTVAIGNGPKKYPGSVLEDNGRLDYQGWYTEGDLIELRPSSTSTSYFYTDLPNFNNRETEAPKTVTYPNEWSTPGNDGRGKPTFVPKTRGHLNTNFEREWTATDEYKATIERQPVIQPTRGYYIPGTTKIPYDPRENNNWTVGPGGPGSRRPPPTSHTLEDEIFPQRATSTLKPIAEDEEGNVSFPDTVLLNPTSRPRRPSFGSRRPIVRPRPGRPGGPQIRPSSEQQQQPVVEDIVFGRPRLPPNQQSDLLQIPGASPPQGLDQVRDFRQRPTPSRRPDSRPAFPGVAPAAAGIDRIDPTKVIEDDISVIEGTFSSRPVIRPTRPIRIKTDNLPFSTNELLNSELSSTIDVTTTRRPFNPSKISRPSTAATSRFTEPAGTFINIDPTSSTRSTAARNPFSPTRTVTRPAFRPTRPKFSTPSVRPTILPPTIATPGAGSAGPLEKDDSTSKANNDIFHLIPKDRPDSNSRPAAPTSGITRDPPTVGITREPTDIPPRGDRPAVFPPIIRKPDPQQATTPSTRPTRPGRVPSGTTPRIQAAGFGPPGSFGGTRPDFSKPEEKEPNRNQAIVEGIPEQTLYVEDEDPETKCQNTCGQNEICQINARGGIECKCRPGFGRPSERSKCEKSRTYQIEVLTTSESREEITVVRLSPQALKESLRKTLKAKTNELFHGVEINSIKVGNSSRRDTFYGGEKNLTRDQDLAIEVLVHVGEDDNLKNKGQIQSLLEYPLTNTDFQSGEADLIVSRVTVGDFDECKSTEHNDCADNAVCYNIEGSYTCACQDGFHDLSGPDSLPGRVCSATTTECDLCNKNGKCILDDSAVVRCECRPWFAGRNCQINLKLLLIVGCVSVILMIVIACGVSCFCCRDRNSAKDNIPSPYGTTMSRMPTNMGRQQQGFMMDPHAGKLKHPAMKSNMIPRPGIMQKPQHMAYSGSSVTSQPGSLSHAAWQSNLSAEAAARGAARGGGGPQLVIPRAKMKPRSRYEGYNSDEDGLSAEANRAISEHNSMGSRHRRKSVPSFASNILGSTRGSRRSRSSPRAGSIDPLLDGSLSDGAESGTLHLSVSRGDLDRADTRSEARSYNETIIRPVTRRLNTPAGTSYRSSRSHATTSEDGRTMAERDGGSSFVVSPRANQLYRLHDSDGSLDSL